MSRVTLLSRGVIAALLACSAVAAEPSSAWDRVREPRLGRAQDLLEESLTARITLLGSAEAADEPLLRDRLREQAFLSAVDLELKGAEDLPSSDLLYFLGSALVKADRGVDEDGRRILRKAVSMDPDSPLAAQAWFEIAVASNRLLDFEAERAAYGEALRATWDPDEQATIFSNRAEATMSLGDLRAARDDYLTAMARATSSGPEVYALAAWGLAVATARDGDLSAALKYAWEASSMIIPHAVPGRGFVRAQALDLPSVFFTPPYEIFFYRALGEMAAAQHADAPKDRTLALSRALSFWDEYLGPARTNGDRWVQNAEFHRTWCVRRLGELGIKLPSEPADSTKGSGSRSRRPPRTRAPD